MNHEIMMYGIAQKVRGRAITNHALPHPDLRSPRPLAAFRSSSASTRRSRNASIGCRATASPRTHLPPLEPKPATPSLSAPFACADADPSAPDAPVHGARARGAPHLQGGRPRGRGALRRGRRGLRGARLPRLRHLHVGCAVPVRPFCPTHARPRH